MTHQIYNLEIHRPRTRPILRMIPAPSLESALQITLHSHPRALLVRELPATAQEVA
jgi:hypothetical protein